MAHRFPALIAAPAAAQERIWLTGARLFDGTGAALRENTAILVEDGIIRRVADAAEPCPDGAWPLDVGQRVLMPGLTDAHPNGSHSPSSSAHRRSWTRACLTHSGGSGLTTDLLVKPPEALSSRAEYPGPERRPPQSARSTRPGRAGRCSLSSA